MTEDQMRHLNDNPLPDGIYDAPQAAIIRYAQKSTRLERIDDKTYGDLAAHFSTQQILDLSFIVGLSNMVNRFHDTFQTDVDPDTLEAVAAGDAIAGACAIPIPKPPG